MTAPVAQPAVTRVLWIVPGVEIPAQYPEFLELATTVIPVAFPVASDCAALCTVCGNTQAAHTWLVTDGHHGPVKDCSEAKR
jgi:hypothetical protein